MHFCRSLWNIALLGMVFGTACSSRPNSGGSSGSTSSGMGGFGGMAQAGGMGGFGGNVEVGGMGGFGGNVEVGGMGGSGGTGGSGGMASETCGNGVLDPGENCDDGNQVNGDECPASCTFAVMKVDINAHSMCALLNDQRLKCWGSNVYGQLGMGDTMHRGDDANEMGANLPALDLGTGKTAVDVSSAGINVCALLNDSHIKCWGAGGHVAGFGGDNKGDNPNEMGDNLQYQDFGLNGVPVFTAAGVYHQCVILKEAGVKCWGNNYNGKLGHGDLSDQGIVPSEMGDNLPVSDLGMGKTATAITAGYNHTCALISDGSVKCWGRNDMGHLGLGDTIQRGDNPNEMGDNLPTVDLGTGKIAIALAAGWDFTCALLNEGEVKCWGENTDGQLGLGDKTHRGDNPGEMGDKLPTIDFGMGKKAVAISAGGKHACALLSDGSVKCWGKNPRGGLGLGHTNTIGDGPNEMGDNLPAVDLGTGVTAVAIAAGGNNGFSCAILTDGRMKCWGDNEFGQLGLGDKQHRGDNPGEMGDNLPLIALW